MKTINNEFNETIYTFTTTSGLEVFVVHRPEFKRSTAAYGTPFGAINLSQSVDGTFIEHPKGAAHFLEHKLFEDDSRDVLSQFADMGADANAFTSYFETVYYFNYNGAIEKPLQLLLDFVSSLSISAQSVEKEKGIIVEEIKMYQQMPDMRLLNETYINTFHNYPFIYDIAGTEDSVNAITLADLQKAYELNYADHNMVLVIVTPEDVKNIADLVETATQSHRRESFKLENHFPYEPLNAAYPSRVIQGAVAVPKMSLTYKFPYKRQNRMIDEFLLRTLLEMNFSEINEVYQTWLDSGIITKEFSYDVDIRGEIGVIYFFNEGQKPEAFRKCVDALMHDLLIEEDMFHQLLKRNYGSMIFSLSQGDRLAMRMLRSHLDGLEYFDYLKAVRNLGMDEMNEIMTLLEQIDSSFLLMNPEV